MISLRVLARALGEMCATMKEGLHERSKDRVGHLEDIGWELPGPLSRFVRTPAGPQLERLTDARNFRSQARLLRPRHGNVDPIARAAPLKGGPTLTSIRKSR